MMVSTILTTQDQRDWNQNTRYSRLGKKCLVFEISSDRDSVEQKITYQSTRGYTIFKFWLFYSAMFTHHIHLIIAVAPLLFQPPKQPLLMRMARTGSV